MNVKSRHNGFTLIEVLVAITILVSAFSVIFPMFSHTGWQLVRTEQWQRRLSLEQNIYRSLSVINPLHENSGHGRISEVDFTWQANPISALVNSRSELEGDGRFMMQMFEIEVTYTLDNKKRTLTFEQLGWHEA